MKRIVSKGIALTVLAVLGMSAPAAAFTPVPIPTPRTGGAVAAHVAHHQARVNREA
jgi:uncharacterized protein (DUF697 family)